MDDFRPRKTNSGRPHFSASPQFRPSSSLSGRDAELRPRQDLDREAASSLSPDPALRPTPPPKQRPTPEGNWYDEPLERTPAPTRTFDPPKNISKKSRRISKKALVISLIIILLLVGGGATYWFVIHPKHKPKPAPAVTQNNDETQAPKALTGNFRMIATGDIITHDSVNQNAKKPDGTYDYVPMLSELKPIIGKADTRICHDTVSAAGSAQGITGYPNFNAPAELLAGLASSGCNILSLASDHIGDKGQAAIDATLQAVDAQKEFVLSAGANRSAEERAKDRYFNVGDGVVKFAYFSYTTKQNKPSTTPYGVNVYDKATAAADIKKVRETANFVIVSMCWGKEDSGDIQPDQDKIAQELADAGADIVFGHCTHIVQPVKQIKSTDGTRSAIVYYSLGNTLNSQLPIETLIGGVAVIDIDLATKKITSTGFMPTYMHYEWTPAQKAAKDINSRKNLKLYPLDKAEAPLAASQNGTTVAAQTARITEILNRFTPTKILKSSDLL